MGLFLRLAPLAFALCGCGAPTSSTPPASTDRPELSASGEEAYERLLRATRFTDDAIYDGGVTPNEVIAIRRLWREPEAAAAFAALEREATLPGRLYALCGLYYAAPATFRQRVDDYRESDETVFFQTGCSGLGDFPVAELVEREPAVRLGPGQSVKEWAASREADGGYFYDVVGGGWPNLFREGGGYAPVRDEDYADWRD